MTTFNKKQNDQVSSSKNPSTQHRSTTQTQDETMPSPQFAEGSAQVAQDTQTQAMAYLFGLLPSQDSQQFERQIEDQRSCRDMLDDMRGFQDILSYWNDVPAPSGLAERTLSLIQSQVEEEHVETAPGGVVAGPSA